MRYMDVSVRETELLFPCAQFWFCVLFQQNLHFKSQRADANLQFIPRWSNFRTLKPSYSLTPISIYLICLAYISLYLSLPLSLIISN